MKPLLWIAPLMLSINCGGGARQVEPDAAGTSADAAGSLRVFVTSQQYDGDLTAAAGVDDGLLAGDALCNASASAAGLGGVFVAYLSIASGTATSAKDRVIGDGPWLAIGSGETVFEDRAALDQVGLASYRNLRTEQGQDLSTLSSGEANVWTGTYRNGSIGVSCSSWTSNGFDVAQCGCLDANCQPTDWREMQYGANEACVCVNPSRLYCFEQPGS